MDEGGFLLVVVIAAVAFLYYRSTRVAQPTAQLGLPPRPGGANGSPGDKNALAHSIGAAVGAGSCLAVATYYGQPAIGKAAAPICGAIGSFVAPYVEKGAVAGAKAVAKGAVAVSHGAVAGAKLAVHEGKVVLEDPFAPAFQVTKGATSVLTGASSVLSRGASLIQKGPPVVQIVGAPVVVAAKVTAPLVKGAAAVANKTTGALESGAKAATHAVASGVHAVLGFL